MNAIAPLDAPGRQSVGQLGAGALAVLVLLGVTAWAATAGRFQTEAAHHVSPATVQHVEGSDIAWVTLTELGASKIGLDVVPVAPSRGEVELPYSALIHAADGTVWVYGSDSEDSLRFRRHQVVVGAVDGDVATLDETPPAGTWVVSAGAAELYGTEFEVGH